MKVKLDGGILPTRAHRLDAGLDLYTPRDVYINGGGSALVDTKVCLEIPSGFVGFVKSKSGLMCRHDIVTDGTVDAGYTGSIRVKLFNRGNEPYSFKAGEKIAQVVVVPCLLDELETVKEFEKTERGDNGFGSTGR